MWTTLGASRLNLDTSQISTQLYQTEYKSTLYIPDKGALSSNSLPNEISRTELGDDGRDSQSAYN